VYRYGRRRRQYLYGSTGLFSGKNHAIVAKRGEREDRTVFTNPRSGPWPCYKPRTFSSEME
jgi:hypothetical protein